MPDPIMALAMFSIASLIFALLCLVAKFLIYRAGHPYTPADLEVARRDAINRSSAVVGGKVTEQLTPLLPHFLEEFDPRDARFLGSPIDFVVFSGLDAGHVEEVVLVEVKTGRSRLTARETQVRRAVDEGRVRFVVLGPAENARGVGLTR